MDIKIISSKFNMKFYIFFISLLIFISYANSQGFLNGIYGENKIVEIMQTLTIMSGLFFTLKKRNLYLKLINKFTYYFKVFF